MKATWNGVVLAESDDTEVVEGNHYGKDNGPHHAHQRPRLAP